MPGRDPLTELVRLWVTKADNDLTMGVQGLKLGKACPTDAVGFHAQQCVEKYLRAYPVNLQNGPFAALRINRPGVFRIGS